MPAIATGNSVVATVTSKNKLFYFITMPLSLKTISSQVIRTNEVRGFDGCRSIDFMQNHKIIHTSLLGWHINRLYNEMSLFLSILILQKIAPYKSVGTFFLNKARRSLFFLSSKLYVFFFFFFFSNKKNFNNDFTTLCKSSIKPPPFQRSPLPLISPTFQGKKVNKPPLPSPNYSSLINYRLY